MRVLVTGAAGQLGREVLRLGTGVGEEVIGLTRAQLDVTDRTAVFDAVRRLRPDAIVNAAAYTAVDRAEAEPARAFAVNRDGARHIAEAAEAARAGLVHLSTDYVFDGGKDGPYAPGDARAPRNAYGASKAAGEDEVLAVMPSAVVLRTAWVFGAHTENFVTTMLRLAAERPRLAVVADQWGHPTPAADLARAAWAAAARARDGLSGVVHVAGAPLATWHDLATAAVAAASALGGVSAVPVDPVPSAAYPSAAARPRRVELELGPSLVVLGLAPIDWRRGLAEVVAAWAAAT